MNLETKKPKARNLEETLYQAHADICGTLSNEKRLRIIDFLSKGELSFGELSTKLGIKRPNLAQHLFILKERGIIEVRRQGKNTFYRISDSRVIEACQLMREVLMDQIRKKQFLLKLKEGKL
ncbi:MAG: ArsR/SmtB family transcription factor [Candidatus Aminicenantia bacterium]